VNSYYKAAMAKGYPMAFNNMAFAYQHGNGVEEDTDKAADLYLETLNRVLHCCWVAVARHLLVEEEKHDRAQVRRVVRELTPWAAALGSTHAYELLAELTAQGKIDPIEVPAAATVNDLPPWFRE